MSALPRISNTEWVVMKVLWADSPLTARQVVDALAGRTRWKDRTIKTFLNRLIKKGAVGSDATRSTYSYFPLVTEAECVREENESFLRRVHGGELQSMLSSFLETRRLSEREIAELRSILDQRRKQK